MTKNHYNPGTVNLDDVTDTILNNGGGISQRQNKDGSVHTSVYSKTENRHFSFDRDADGKISGVHSTKNNDQHITYKGGK